MNIIRVTTQKSKRQSSASKTQAREDELIADLLETRRKILDLTSTFSPAEHDHTFAGIWSIKDLVAHLIGSGAKHQHIVKALRSGKLPEFYAYVDPDWQTDNARLVSTYKRGSSEQSSSAYFRPFRPKNSNRIRE